MSNYKDADADEMILLREDNPQACEELQKQLKTQVSEMLIKKRMELKMSQAEFAKCFGTAQSQISRWENGECNFSLRQIAVIAYKLDYNISLRIE